MSAHGWLVMVGCEPARSVGVRVCFCVGVGMARFEEESRGRKEGSGLCGARSCCFYLGVDWDPLFVSEF